MKKIIYIFLIFIVSIANCNAKIVSVDGQFKLDIPLKHTYLNLERIDAANELFDYDSIKSSGFEVYLVGDDKLMGLLQTYFEGGDITENFELQIDCLDLLRLFLNQYCHKKIYFHNLKHFR